MSLLAAEQLLSQQFSPLDDPGSDIPPEMMRRTGSPVSGCSVKALSVIF